MPLFTTDDAHEIIDMFRRYHDEIGRALGRSSHEGSSDFGGASPLARDLMLLIDVANGVYVRTDQQVRNVDQALARVRALLVANVIGSPGPLVDLFWQTKLGVILSRASWWVFAEDLITISNAAALAFGENNQANRMRIARAIDAGALDWVPDPSVANPQQHRRVLRSQVERLRELRRLPEAE